MSLHTCVPVLLTHLQLFVTLCTLCTHQAPLSMGFPRQEYWRGLSFPPPEHRPNPGIEPAPPVSPALTSRCCLPRHHLGIPTNVLKVKVKVKALSRVRVFVTPWTVAHQAPLSMEFSRQEYWSGLPFPSPGDLPDSGIEPRSPALQAEALTSEAPGKPLVDINYTTEQTKACDFLVILHAL